MNTNAIDSVIVFTSAAATTASAVLMSEAPPQDLQEYAELRLLLLPLIGSMFMSGGMILLNPNPDSRRVVIGRSFIALFFGVLLPQFIGLFHPSLAEMSLKPVALVMLGGLCSALAYVMSAPVVRQFYNRADGIAEREVEKIEKRFSPDD
jgi:hypothetical protein